MRIGNLLEDNDEGGLTGEESRMFEEVDCGD